MDQEERASLLRKKNTGSLNGTISVSTEATTAAPYHPALIYSLCVIAALSFGFYNLFQAYQGKQLGLKSLYP